MDKSKDIKYLKEEIETKKAELDKLIKMQSEFNGLPAKYKLAEKIHAKTCRWNHTDGCSFEYEDWYDNLGSSRQHYVEKAERILAKVDYTHAALTLDLI